MLYGFKYSIFNHKQFNWLYVYNIKQSCFLKLKSTNKISTFSNCGLCIEHKQSDIYIPKIQIFLKNLYKFEYVKIKFSGKGYKIKKNSKKSIILLFNRSHITTLWWKNIILKKIKKYKIYIKYTPITQNITRTLMCVRSINPFTKKGLRKSKQILFKKKGKK